MSIASDQAVVIWGEILWDLFPDGEQLGGAPANVAWHLGLAGGWPQLVTRVGDDDAGRRAVEKMGEVCDVSLVQVDRERATGVVEVRVEGGEPRYRLVPERAWERIECTAAVKAALAEAGVLVYGTLAQRTRDGIVGWRDAVNAAGKCLKVCDLNLRRTEHADDGERVAVDEALGAADVVKVNDKELARLSEWRGWSDPVAALAPRVVAVTHGAGGSTIVGRQGAVRVPGVAARPGGDNVGCGDAYLAILVHGMTLGWEIARCGAAASRWASAVAACRGATPMFSEEQIEDLLGGEA